MSVKKIRSIGRPNQKILMQTCTLCRKKTIWAFFSLDHCKGGRASFKEGGCFLKKVWEEVHPFQKNNNHNRKGVYLFLIYESSVSLPSVIKEKFCWRKGHTPSLQWSKGKNAQTSFFLLRVHVCINIFWLWPLIDLIFFTDTFSWPSRIFYIPKTLSLYH